MNEKKKPQESKPYGPNERDYLEASVEPVKAFSLEDYTLLPNHVVDPIVVNNISNAEFDYTYNGDSDLLNFGEQPLASINKNTPN
ncbi:MAG: hypothetical protein RR891_09420 [Clostridium sp.]|uniref:hypothetical protein n=1 Tax=Clostridium sp. TaxID=1506 RepID=UPI0030434214